MVSVYYFTSLSPAIILKPLSVNPCCIFPQAAIIIYTGAILI
jgi:hypothetical protein